MEIWRHGRSFSGPMPGVHPPPHGKVTGAVSLVNMAKLWGSVCNGLVVVDSSGRRRLWPAALLLLSGLGALFRGRFLGAFGGVLFGGGFLAAGVAAILLGLNVQSYARLVHERPVATITLSQIETSVLRGDRDPA